MQRFKKIIRRQTCSDLHQIEDESSFYDTDILRKAYELIMENSKFFYDVLADAFVNAQQIQNINSTEMFVE
jgi:hypothetical protein